MKLVLSAVVVVALATAAVAAAPVGGKTLPVRAEQAPAKKDAKQEQAVAVRLNRLARTVGTLRSSTWSCQERLGVPRTTASVSVWSLPRSVSYRQWVVARWQTRSEGCKNALKRRTIPTTSDWLTAVDLVQRIYPGTKQWLTDCSAHEGGHGGWVPNHQGSGANGWMQMMYGTFTAYNDTAYADARAKGFIVDQRTNSWYHPLGQAITSAYMRTHGASSNWDPRIDPYCR